MHYNNSIAARRGTPRLTLIAKCTPGHNFSARKSSRQRDIEELERMLITNAISKNRSLMNIRGTRILHEMVDPGMLNTPPGKPNSDVTGFKKILGL